MKNLFYFFLPFMLIISQCSSEESLELKKPYNVNMNFVVDGVQQTITANFAYDNTQKRYRVVNTDVLEEIKAINESTKEEMYVYFPKSSSKTSTGAKFEIKTGYYGYSSASGCYYFGTLYVGDNGQSIFVAATGANAVANPPLCGYYFA